MPTNANYHEGYPRMGDVAILCEGDVIGYESGILRRWADQEVRNNPLVDIWPCGTAGAIFGVSDAIGRSRPLIVIEDRDFRSGEEATSDCNKSKGDRKRRDVRVLDWRTWQRNEIENYLLEPDVVLDVMATAFDRTPQDIQAALSEILPTLAVYQATQYALYRARRSWDLSDPARILSSNVDCRPIWDDEACSVKAPSRDAVKDSLRVNLKKWQEISNFAADGQEAGQDRGLVEDFDSKCDEWEKVDWNSPVWLIDWTGKEVLQWLRRLLTSRYGWWEPSSGDRVRIEWNRLSRTQRDAKDREIEAGLRPLLIAQFVRYASALTDGEVYQELRSIKEALLSWNVAE